MWRIWQLEFGIRLRKWVSFEEYQKSSAFCTPQFPFAFEFECERPNGNLAVHKSFELPFWSVTLRNTNTFYFEISGQIAIQLFSIKKHENFWAEEWQFSCTQVIWPFTLKLKGKRNPRHSKHTKSIFRRFIMKWNKFSSEHN